MSLDKRYASRKFVLACVVFVTATGLRIAGLIDQAGWVTITLAVVAAYFAVNYAQGVAEAKAAPVVTPGS